MLAITAQATDAPLPGFSLTPSVLTFSNVTPDTTSAAQTVLLSNSSVAARNITSIAITGTNAASFVETNNCPASVIASSICTITVTMQPTAANTSYSAALTVVGNAGSSTGITQSVALTGTSGASGPAPQLVIAPTSLDFTGKPVGTSVLKSIMLTNHGTSALILNSIAISGSTNFIPQSSAITCGTSLAAGASCTYTVDFYAAAMGSFTGTLVITDNALGSPQSVPLTGSGVQAIASFTNGPVSFANVTANTASQPFNLELENTGNIALNISSLTLAPSSPSVFSETNTCGASVAPNALCTITVNFKPNVAATAYATYLTLASNASPAEQTVTVTGTSSGYAAQTADAVGRHLTAIRPQPRSFRYGQQ
ncbi:MAG: choice-of-anchor D domain-containing protein [Acidobacteriaceae bacterium]